MRVPQFQRCIPGMFILLTGIASPNAAAQTDTTRRPTSEQRIPVRKERPVRESRGDVELAVEAARINVLEEIAAVLRQRVKALETERAALDSRVEANNVSIKTLDSMLQTIREDLFRVRYALALATTRAANLEQKIDRFDRSLSGLRHGSLFGHSGFYMAVGTGMNFATGTLHNVGYGSGLNVVLPIGWSKPGQLLGVRAELAAQAFEASVIPGFRNIDPVAYSANAMLTVNLPMNTARTNLFYLMGGGGIFMFERVGTTSALADRLGESDGRATKFGVTGGAGFEFHILGATSLFLESAITNVFGDRPVTTTGNNQHLRWVPLVAGIVLR
jgi:hypothetical protein